MDNKRSSHEAPLRYASSIRGEGGRFRALFRIWSVLSVLFWCACLVALLTAPGTAGSVDWTGLPVLLRIAYAMYEYKGVWHPIVYLPLSCTVAAMYLLRIGSSKLRNVVVGVFVVTLIASFGADLYVDVMTPFRVPQKWEHAFQRTFITEVHWGLKILWYGLVMCSFVPLIALWLPNARTGTASSRFGDSG